MTEFFFCLMFHHQQNNLEKNKLMRKKDSQREENITFPHCTSHYCFEFTQNILGILVLNIHTLSSLHTLSNVRKTRNLHKQYQSSFWLIYCIRRNDLDSWIISSVTQWTESFDDSFLVKSLPCLWDVNWTSWFLKSLCIVPNCLSQTEYM